MFHHNHIICYVHPEFDITLTMNSPSDQAVDNCDVSFNTIFNGDTKIRCYRWGVVGENDYAEWIFVEEKTSDTQEKTHSINFANLEPITWYRFDCYSKIGSTYTIFNSKVGQTPPAHTVEIIDLGGGGGERG